MDYSPTSQRRLPAVLRVRWDNFWGDSCTLAWIASGKFGLFGSPVCAPCQTVARSDDVTQRAAGEDRTTFAGGGGIFLETINIFFKYILCEKLRGFWNQAVLQNSAISAPISNFCGNYAAFLKSCAPRIFLRPFLDFAGFSAITESRFSGGSD